ncbi:P-loop containing nucleoside triphosphate hydrolase protein, partial [Blyttiomyces helicus]
WRTFFRRIKMILPFLWPKKRGFQFLVVICLILLISGRIVNMLVPFQYWRVVQDLSSDENGRKLPYFSYGTIIIYGLLRFLQGNSGLLSSIQSFLWIKVEQYTTRAVSVRILEHLHSLSLQFHLFRKTGEVLRVVERGTSSISSLLSYFLFNMGPVVLDTVAGVVVMLYTFDAAVGGILLSTMILYIATTIALTEWRTKFRREMITLDNAAKAHAVDSLLNFETVKYYGNEAFEVKRYEEAILKYQAADWVSSASLNILNTAQNTITTLGLLAGALLVGKREYDGEVETGALIFFLAYLAQLSGPLNWFGTLYRVIQQNFTDMEKMMELFENENIIKDSPNAAELKVSHGGSIKFENVGFAYDARQPAVQGLTFEVPAGKTVALVGPSGGGKTTIFRLLFRFYEVTSGSIKIDGQDIRDVKQSSLRHSIGVVPQDTVLFNDTVRYNIRYGNIAASDAEVEAAAAAAQIHEKVLTFPEGYETKVGERGLRLSGGEKQRVAIARTLLKNPPIVLLDEATSALDNTTERLIQESLQTLSANRTTLVIAHRLSTIVHSDLILVVKDGKIVERGTHQQLLRQGEGGLRDDGVGTYFDMWTKERQKPVPASPAVPDAPEKEGISQRSHHGHGRGHHG